MAIRSCFIKNFMSWSVLYYQSSKLLSFHSGYTITHTKNNLHVEAKLNDTSITFCITLHVIRIKTLQNFRATFKLHLQTATESVCRLRFHFARRLARNCRKSSRVNIWSVRCAGLKFREQLKEKSRAASLQGSLIISCEFWSHLEMPTPR